MFRWPPICVWVLCISSWCVNGQGMETDRGVGCSGPLLVCSNTTWRDLTHLITVLPGHHYTCGDDKWGHHQLSKRYIPASLTNLLFPSRINNLINTLYTSLWQSFLRTISESSIHSITDLNCCKTQHTATNIHLQDLGWPKRFGFFLVVQPRYTHSMFKILSAYKHLLNHEDIINEGFLHVLAFLSLFKAHLKYNRCDANTSTELRPRPPCRLTERSGGFRVPLRGPVKTLSSTTQYELHWPFTHTHTHTHTHT